MRARKIDLNQREIVEAFRAMGCSVFITSSQGCGFPDIICGRAGKNYLFEIKSKTGKLTPKEKAFFDIWNGQVKIIRTREEVFEFIEGIKNA